MMCTDHATSLSSRAESHEIRELREFSDLGETTAMFALSGGFYQLTAIAVEHGRTLRLQWRGGKTWFNASDNITDDTPPHGVTLLLPRGRYRLVVDGSAIGLTVLIKRVQTSRSRLDS
jgi:hypothetical protein